MAKLFIFGIGGTGARVIKSLTMLLAAGLKSRNDFEIVPIIIDPHKDNEDLKRTVSALNNYQKITENAGLSNGFFGTKISTLQSLDPDNNLSGTYTFNLQEVANTKFKDYFSYNSLGDENKAFAGLAWEYFVQRLFHRRAARLRMWREQLAKRDLPGMLEGGPQPA